MTQKAPKKCRKFQKRYQNCEKIWEGTFVQNEARNRRQEYGGESVGWQAQVPNSRWSFFARGVPPGTSSVPLHLAQTLDLVESRQTEYRSPGRRKQHQRTNSIAMLPFVWFSPLVIVPHWAQMNLWVGIDGSATLSPPGSTIARLQVGQEVSCHAISSGYSMGWPQSQVVLSIVFLQEF